MSEEMNSSNSSMTGSEGNVPGLHVDHPAIHLAVVCGATVAGLVVLVVVTVVIAIVCHKIRENTRPYYAVAKKRAENNNRQDTGLVRSNAGLTELQRSGECSVHELLATQEVSLEEEQSSEFAECSATADTLDRSQDVEQGAGTGIYGDIDDEGHLTSDPAGKKCDQFSFENGATLQDYPASVDLEVTGSDNDCDAQKVKIMGYPDIYNSQILKTVPPVGEECMTDEKGGKYLTLPLPRESKRGPATEKLSSSPPVASELNVPTIVAGQPVISTSQGATAYEVSAGFAEAQELLNRSVCDLLEMTEAMTEEMNPNSTEEEIIAEGVSVADGEDSVTNNFSSPTFQGDDVSLTKFKSPHELDSGIQRTMLGEDDIEELHISHV